MEVPGGSLEDSLRDLTATVTMQEPAESADTLCEHVIVAMPEGRSYDDIAILAIRLLGSEPGPTEPKGSEDAQPSSRDTSRSGLQADLASQH